MITIEIANEYIDENVLEVVQITEKGTVNNTYIFITSENKYIVRIDPNETTINRFQKEKWCMSQAKQIGIPTPIVYKIGIKNNHPYMVMSYISGTDGSDLARNEQKIVWQKLGQYSRKIHDIKIIWYGENMTSPGVFDWDWNKFIEYNINSLNENDKLISLKIIEPTQSKILRNIFERIKNSSFRFGLIHNDLSLNNTRIDENGNVYLLDWGSAEVNIVPHIDIIEITQSSLEDNSEYFETFLENYGISRNEYKTLKPNISALKLLQCIDKLRWAIDKRPELIKEKAEIFKNVFHDYRKNSGKETW